MSLFGMDILATPSATLEPDPDAKRCKSGYGNDGNHGCAKEFQYGVHSSASFPDRSMTGKLAVLMSEQVSHKREGDDGRPHTPA